MKKKQLHNLHIKISYPSVVINISVIRLDSCDIFSTIQTIFRNDPVSNNEESCLLWQETRSRKLEISNWTWKGKNIREWNSTRDPIVTRGRRKFAELLSEYAARFNSSAHKHARYEGFCPRNVLIPWCITRYIVDATTTNRCHNNSE